MSSAPKHGDPVPAELRQELVDLIEAGQRAMTAVVRTQASEYATKHLGMSNPKPSEIWDYVTGRLRAGIGLCYTNLDDWPDRWGYAMRNADGQGLYIKMRFDDQGRVVLMSFHE